MNEKIVTVRIFIIELRNSDFVSFIPENWNWLQSVFETISALIAYNPYVAV